MNFDVSEVFVKNYNAFYNKSIDECRVIVNQGGTRSSKTYSICQMLISDAVTYPDKKQVISIVRKTTPSIKKSVLRDFLEILENNDLFSEKSFNRTELQYKLNNTLFEFFSLDEPQKVRGSKRDILYANEANELTLEDWRQLMLRTTGKAIIDYNPSDEFHWIYDSVLTRKDAVFIQSTYLDNPFLDEVTIKEIESYRDKDPVYWRVFGLGERGSSKATVYTHWKMIDSMPEGGYSCYGLDFGYNHPMALNHIILKENGVYCDEKIYESRLTIPDLIDKMDKMKINKGDFIFCDSAEPRNIQLLRNAGYNAVKADKSVKSGIDCIKSRYFFITKNSVNTLKEVKFYKYKQDVNENILEEVVKINDDSMDALRYGAYGAIKMMTGSTTKSVSYLNKIL